MKKIESMTKEQEALVPVHLKKWLDNGYRTDTVDKDKACEGVHWLYEIQLKKPKPKVWFCDGPWQFLIISFFLKKGFGSSLNANLRDSLNANLRDNLSSNLSNNLYANLLANLSSNLRDNLRDNLCDNLLADLSSNLRDNLCDNLSTNLSDNLSSNLGDNLYANLGDSLRDNLYINLGTNLRDNLSNNLSDNLKQSSNADFKKWGLETFSKFLAPNWQRSSWYYWGWVGFYDFILNELFPSEVDKCKDFLKYVEISKDLHIIYPFEGICFVIDRPCEIHLDQESNGRRRLHNFDKSALLYRDGYGLDAIHGIRVPKLVIETNKDAFTKEMILNETNADHRRCIIQKIGIEKTIELLGAEIIDAYDSPVGGRYELLSVDYDGRGKRPYLKMKSQSIDAYHIEGVPTETKTVKEAICFRNGLDTFEEPQTLT